MKIILKAFVFIITFLWVLPLFGADILTRNNTVKFTVPDHWIVIGVQTNPPMTVVAFQIPNEADEGTPDSTNLSFSTFELSEKKSLDELLNRYSAADLLTSSYKGWILNSYQSMQEQTKYQIRDIYRQVDGFYIMIRLAWPMLRQNPENYDLLMEKTLRQVVNSVKLE